MLPTSRPTTYIIFLHVTEILPITQDFLNMEFALQYGIWELLRHEEIPETHVLGALLTGNACCSMAK